MGHYCGFKKPKTTQERKANQDWPVRGRRSPRQLPDEYDDVHRSNIRQRSWKRYRKTQYKTKLIE